MSNHDDEVVEVRLRRPTTLREALAGVGITLEEADYLPDGTLLIKRGRLTHVALQSLPEGMTPEQAREYGVHPMTNIPKWSPLHPDAPKPQYDHAPEGTGLEALAEANDAAIAAGAPVQRVVLEAQSLADLLRTYSRDHASITVEVSMITTLATELEGAYTDASNAARRLTREACECTDMQKAQRKLDEAGEALRRADGYRRSLHVLVSQLPDTVLEQMYGPGWVATVAGIGRGVDTTR